MAGPLRRLLSGLAQLLAVVSAEEDEITCGIWFAKSTIPGAGLGVFAGKDFEQQSSLLPIGDVVIPIVDMVIHHPESAEFLWDEYTWDGASLFMENEGLSQEMNAASPGFGASVNCFMDLTNVKETVPLNANAGLHRSKDPGAGAFSPYWNRDSIASAPISVGNELFTSYGASWFTSRDEIIGPVPLKGDLQKGNNLIFRFTSLEERLKSEVRSEILEDLWESFVWKNNWNDTSRVLFGLPKNWEEIRRARNITLTNLKREQHSQSIGWLEEHGICGDLITVKNSTIRQAGRGAFARKSFQKGEVVAPFPLIHLTNRSRLDMFEIYGDSGTFVADETRKTKEQLLLNYCMGHRESTLLLCPYGTLSSHINHNQTLANVKLEWADPKNSNHQPDWIVNKTLADLYRISSAGLAMNVVATKAIRIGDEIFLDYGDEWEKAWQDHVERWKPVDGAEGYKSAEQLNEEKGIKTEFEILSSPYPSNVEIKFSKTFLKSRDVWFKHWEEGNIEAHMIKDDQYFSHCEVLNRDIDDDGNVWYSVIPIDLTDKNDDEEDEEPIKISGIPPEAFRFFDRPYTSDMHQANAFRHDIRIPDYLFPLLWRNKSPVSDAKEDERSEL